MEDQSLISSRSAGELSFASQESVLNETSQNSQNTEWRKNEWLKKHFKTEKRGKNIVVVCVHCGHTDRNRGHPRMRRHINMCPKTRLDQNLPIVQREPETENSTTTKMFVKALIAGGWAFRGIETREFKEFIARKTSSWKIPPRQDISSVYVAEMSEQLQEAFIESLKMTNATTLSVEFDHWRDVTGRSFLGIMITGNSGKRHLLALVDVSLMSHSASVILEDLVNSLRVIPPKSINSIVSDSASSCKRARQDMVKLPEFKHVIQHRCIAHLVNLIGAYLTDKRKNPQFAKLIDHAAKITNLIRGSTYWSAHIKTLGKKKPQSACPTRWYSLYIELTALSELKDVIVENIAAEVDADKSIMINSFDWALADEMIDEIEPLVTCIGYIERRDTSVGEAMHHILDYAKQLFSNRPKSNNGTLKDKTVNHQTRVAFLHHFNENYLGDEFGLYLAAYALDRRTKLNYITLDGLKMCMKTISAIAVKSGARLNLIRASLFIEFEDYKNFVGNYKMTEQKSIDWWRDRNSGGILPTIGLRLAHLKATSTNLERSFSTIKHIQGGYRLSFSSENLLNLARMKIALLEENMKPRRRSLGGFSVVSDTEDEPTTDGDDQSSSITSLDDDADWIEDEAIRVKMNSQSFFKYIDFSIINDCNANEHGSFEEVTEEQINECVEASFRTEVLEDVIVDDLLVMARSSVTMDYDAN